MIIVTGGSGRLGQALRKLLANAVYPSRQELDVLNPTAVETYIAEHQPSVFLHAAAWTDVRAAESNREQCWATNVGGTENVVRALQQYAPNCFLVYVSTACVFQGDRGDYSEEDQPYPKNFYGVSKLVSEYVAMRMPQHLVVRTNFVAHEPWPFPRAFTDRFGTYLFAEDVAAGLCQLIEARRGGLYHLAGSRRMSMLELARLTSPEVEPMTMADVSIPLTKDMTLRSVHLAPLEIGSNLPATERAAVRTTT